MLRTPVFETASGIFVILLTLSVFMDTWTRAQSHAQRDPSGPEANEDRRRRFTHRRRDRRGNPCHVEPGRRGDGKGHGGPRCLRQSDERLRHPGRTVRHHRRGDGRPAPLLNDNRFIFEEVERISDGLGPTYNAQSCRECHQNVVTGGASQVAEHRTGRLQNGQFFESLGGSLIQSRATHPEIAERVTFQDDIRTFRISTNTLGNGFVEAISNTTLVAIRDAQPVERAGHHADRAGARGKRRRPLRQIRLEESAREPRVVFGGRLSRMRWGSPRRHSPMKIRRPAATSADTIPSPTPKTME